jgi:DNA-binding NarL/FixJ family response regulator
MTSASDPSLRSIRLLIVDDHPVVREGLRAVLSQHADFVVVGEAQDGLAAVEAWRRLRPDVTLMDLRLTGMDGAEAIAAIRQIDPAARVIVITSFETRADVERALTAGARGLLLKSMPAEQLMDSVRRVHSGLKAIDSQLMQRFRVAGALPDLTAREIDVLRRVVQGQRNQQIADALDVSLSTVKFHLNQILAKLDARDRTEAAMIAVREGIVRL